jgi:hypothetical protein
MSSTHRPNTFYMAAVGAIADAARWSLIALIATTFLTSACIVITKPSAAGSPQPTAEQSKQMNTPPLVQTAVPTQVPTTPPPLTGSVSVTADLSGKEFKLAIGTVVQVRLTSPGGGRAWKEPFLAPRSNAAMALLGASRQPSGSSTGDFKAVHSGDAVICAFQASTASAATISPISSPSSTANSACDGATAIWMFHVVS